MERITTWPRDYKTLFMLNSTEHGNFHAHNCQNDNNSWRFNIYERENSILSLSEPEKC